MKHDLKSAKILNFINVLITIILCYQRGNGHGKSNVLRSSIKLLDPYGSNVGAYGE